MVSRRPTRLSTVKPEETSTTVDADQNNDIARERADEEAIPASEPAAPPPTPPPPPRPPATKNRRTLAREAAAAAAASRRNQNRAVAASLSAGKTEITVKADTSVAAASSDESKLNKNRGKASDAVDTIVKHSSSLEAADNKVVVNEKLSDNANMKMPENDSTVPATGKRRSARGDAGRTPSPRTKGSPAPPKSSDSPRSRTRAQTEVVAAVEAEVKAESDSVIEKTSGDSEVSNRRTDMNDKRSQEDSTSALGRRRPRVEREKRKTAAERKEEEFMKRALAMIASQEQSAASGRRCRAGALTAAELAMQDTSVVRAQQGSSRKVSAARARDREAESEVESEEQSPEREDKEDGGRRMRRRPPGKRKAVEENEDESGEEGDREDEGDSPTKEKSTMKEPMKKKSRGRPPGKRKAEDEPSEDGDIGAKRTAKSTKKGRSASRRRQSQSPSAELSGTGSFKETDKPAEASKEQDSEASEPDKPQSKFAPGSTRRGRPPKSAVASAGDADAASQPRKARSPDASPDDADRAASPGRQSGRRGRPRKALSVSDEEEYTPSGGKKKAVKEAGRRAAAGTRASAAEDAAAAAVAADKIPSSTLVLETEDELRVGMYKVLESVAAHEDAWPFMEAVQEEYAPDYYAVIRRPMDLGKLESRLDAGVYQTRQQFEADFKLIVDNCKLYNGLENEYTDMVLTLESEFRKAIKKYMHPTDEEEEIFIDVSQMPDRSRRSSGARLNSESTVNTGKKRGRKPSTNSAGRGRKKAGAKAKFVDYSDDELLASPPSKPPTKEDTERLFNDLLSSPVRRHSSSAAVESSPTEHISPRRKYGSSQKYARQISPVRKQTSPGRRKKAATIPRKLRKNVPLSQLVAPADGKGDAYTFRDDDFDDDLVARRPLSLRPVRAASPPAPPPAETPARDPSPPAVPEMTDDDEDGASDAGDPNKAIAQGRIFAAKMRRDRKAAAEAARVENETATTRPSKPGGEEPLSPAVNSPQPSPSQQSAGGLSRASSRTNGSLGVEPGERTRRKSRAAKRSRADSRDAKEAKRSSKKKRRKARERARRAHERLHGDGEEPKEQEATGSSREEVAGASPTSDPYMGDEPAAADLRASSDSDASDIWREPDKPPPPLPHPPPTDLSMKARSVGSVFSRDAVRPSAVKGKSQFSSRSISKEESAKLGELISRVKDSRGGGSTLLAHGPGLTMGKMLGGLGAERPREKTGEEAWEEMVGRRLRTEPALPERRPSGEDEPLRLISDPEEGRELPTLKKSATPNLSAWFAAFRSEKEAAAASTPPPALPKPKKPPEEKPRPSPAQAETDKPAARPSVSAASVKSPEKPMVLSAAQRKSHAPPHQSAASAGAGAADAAARRRPTADGAAAAAAASSSTDRAADPYDYADDELERARLQVRGAGGHLASPMYSTTSESEKSPATPAGGIVSPAERQRSPAFSPKHQPDIRAVQPGFYQDVTQRSGTSPAASPASVSTSPSQRPASPAASRLLSGQPSTVAPVTASPLTMGAATSASTPSTAVPSTPTSTHSHRQSEPSPHTAGAVTPPVSAESSSRPPSVGLSGYPLKKRVSTTPPETPAVTGNLAHLSQLVTNLPLEPGSAQQPAGADPPASSAPQNLTVQQPAKPDSQEQSRAAAAYGEPSPRMSSVQAQAQAPVPRPNPADVARQLMQQQKALQLEQQVKLIEQKQKMKQLQQQGSTEKPPPAKDDQPQQRQNVQQQQLQQEQEQQRQQLHQEQQRQEQQQEQQRQEQLQEQQRQEQQRQEQQRQEHQRQQEQQRQEQQRQEQQMQQQQQQQEQQRQDQQRRQLQQMQQMQQQQQQQQMAQQQQQQRSGQQAHVQQAVSKPSDMQQAQMSQWGGNAVSYYKQMASPHMQLYHQQQQSMKAFQQQQQQPGGGAQQHVQSADQQSQHQQPAAEAAGAPSSTSGATAAGGLNLSGLMAGAAAGYGALGLSHGFQGYPYSLLSQSRSPQPAHQNQASSGGAAAGGAGGGAAAGAAAAAGTGGGQAAAGLLPAFAGSRGHPLGSDSVYQQYYRQQSELLQQQAMMGLMGAAAAGGYPPGYPHLSTLRQRFQPPGGVSRSPFF